MNCDIKWHNCENEMPGTDYEYSNSCLNKFLLRYSHEDDLSDYFYRIGKLVNGQFEIRYSDPDCNDGTQPTFTHWAFVDHPSDYD